MKNKEKSAAIVTIKDAPKMSKRGRNAIANWLERQARFLRSDGKMFSNRFTARYIYSILIAVCLIAAPAVFTGCGTTDQSREAIVFYTFKDVQTVVHRAYDVFAEKVVLKEVSPEERAKVEEAYARYQKAFSTAFALANSDLSQFTPANVQRLADEIVKLIYKL